MYGKGLRFLEKKSMKHKSLIKVMTEQCKAFRTENQTAPTFGLNRFCFTGNCS